jgi:hypothetical protein
MTFEPFVAYELVKVARWGARAQHQEARTNEDGHQAIHVDDCTHLRCRVIQRAIKSLADDILVHVGQLDRDECEANCPRCEYEKWGA